MQISLNIIDILCLHIFFWIRSNSRITFIVFGGELIHVLSIVVCIPSTFCPTLDHHQGRIYYKSDVTFVLAYYYCVRASLKKHSCPTTQLRKILTDNTTILEHQNNKQKIQIREALHIRNMQPTLNRINFQTSANILKSL